MAFGSIQIILLVLIARNFDLQNALPFITLYLFAGYRLIPSLQEIYSSFGKLRFVKRPLNNLYEDSRNLIKFRDSENINDIKNRFKRITSSRENKFFL